MMIVTGRRLVCSYYNNTLSQFALDSVSKSTAVCRFAALVLILICSISATAHAANRFTSPNFVVTASSPEFAKQVAETAEKFRKELSIDWLGKEMPNWYRPCPIFVTDGQMGAGGDTTFSFCNGEVYGWKMNVRGTRERILDSVIPHEVTHTILACHFRSPLPRWADEGASTLIEHDSEKQRQLDILVDRLQSSRRIPLRKLFEIREYPSDMKDVYTLYAEGYSVTDYLVEQSGKKKFLAFVKDGLDGNWDQALQHHYKLSNIEKLESSWNNWVIAGSPRMSTPVGTAIASHDEPRRSTGVNTPELQPQLLAAPKRQLAGQIASNAAPTHNMLSSTPSVVNNNLVAAVPVETSSEVIDMTNVNVPGVPGMTMDLSPRRQRNTLERPVYTLRPVQQSSYEAGPTHLTAQTHQGKDLFTE